MGFHANKQAVVLTVMSQLPIVLLLLIFHRIPGIPLLFRWLATGLVVFEAALMFELIGNIVQKVRCDDKGIVVRGVLERHRIPWKEVRGLRQVVVSPMRGGGLSCRQPSKLFLVKSGSLERADAWWVKRGPVANGQRGLSGIVERYDAWVRGQLKGWGVLWVVEYREPQRSVDDDRLRYSFLDGREKATVDGLVRHYGRELSFLDCTYPRFVALRGGKYAGDVEHVWETLA